MMHDSELLKMAAKAIGVNIAQGPRIAIGGKIWNPLTDDGDAFHLAAKLRMRVDFESLHAGSVWGQFIDDWIYGYSNDGMVEEIGEKTRRAIVIAAAEIGKTK
jgi:hypothetical protein